MRGTTRNPFRSTETSPSQTELTVAKALLLLSSKPISINFRYNYSADKSVRDEDSSPSDSRSGSSTVTSDSGSVRVAQAHLLRVLAAAAHLQDAKLKVKSRSDEYSSPGDSKSSSAFSSEASSTRNVEVSVATRPHELKFKVIRRARSKPYRNPHPHRRGRLSFTWRKPAFLASSPPSEERTEDSSASKAKRAVLALPIQNPVKIRHRNNRSPEPKRQKVASAYLKRRADVIFKFLSAGSASEVRIREAIGNSPDTSKALRMLLKLEKVTRYGAGGQKDPYIYTVAGSGGTIDSGSGSAIDSS